MNIIQRIIIILFGILISYTIINPPWVQTFQRPGISKQRTPISRSNNIFYPPKLLSDSPYYGIEVDKDRLYMKVFLVVVLSVAGYFVAGNINIPQNKILILKKIRFEKTSDVNIKIPTDKSKILKIYGYFLAACFLLILFNMLLAVSLYRKVKDLNSVVEILTSIK